MTLAVMIVDDDDDADVDEVDVDDPRAGTCNGGDDDGIGGVIAGDTTVRDDVVDVDPMDKAVSLVGTPDFGRR